MSRNIPEPHFEYDAEKLAAQYRDAVRRILAEMESFSGKGMSKQFAAAALADLSERLGELDDVSRKWVEENIPKAAREGAAAAMYVLGGAASIEEARKLVRFSSLNEHMVKTMIADTQNDLLAVTQNVDRRVRNAIRTSAAEVMRQNMAEGINGHRTNRDMILTDLRTKLGSALDTGIVDAAGRRWKPDVYVNMLVRTKMMIVHTEATTNEALAEGIQYAKISSHGAKDACGLWEGKTVKLVASAPGSYPTVDQARASKQIFHPNCKHLIIPIPDPAMNNKKTPKPEAEQKADKKKRVPSDSTIPIDKKKKKEDNGIQVREDKRDLSTGDKGRDVMVHTYPDGLEIVIPKDMNWSKQTYTQEQIRKSFDKLPQKLREGVKEINLLDGQNEYDSYWESKYNMKDFRSFATGGGGKINFFANDVFGKQSNDDYLFHTLAHESAHVLDSAKTKDGKWFSEGQKWSDAKFMDFVHSQKQDSSWYAESSGSIKEDFADAVSYYVQKKADFLKDFPNRSMIIKEMLKNG